MLPPIVLFCYRGACCGNFFLRALYNRLDGFLTPAGITVGISLSDLMKLVQVVVPAHYAVDISRENIHQDCLSQSKPMS